ncbi:S-adenosyl-L-methionine-dependent methyltransferase [Aspergillus saccharolyticus JOP 1030-1]|uniref:S-adenosyl-L-methionine-dependent methyltransferase n=1 Tax=Aspergillus saccharolyticus JOP 1030-1 TaxID=1450539 RepID=A0A319AKK5_9EURO|nr:S-adenosyl-L-methionine-dependent methyltransferase [Aspergillus saccharolyticus JOP 1030-1]PYH47152.1 S-adenosyl-L-methionine-dependent methyltransferase [Aspergillus saccharolyticus JOP 1030-1]
MTYPSQAQRQPLFKLPRVGLAAILTTLNSPGEIELPDGTVVPVNPPKPPIWRVTFHTTASLRTPITEMAVGEAYVKGAISVSGKLLSLLASRPDLESKAPLRQRLRFLYDYYLRSNTRMNAQSVSDHYGRGEDLFLTFIDTRYRFYTQGIFDQQEATGQRLSIEDASERKLERIFAALRLEAGMRVLDVGGGWGGVTQYCGAKGVHVTTLTLLESQARYVEQLRERMQLPGQVVVGDYWQWESEREFDAVVILGVIEHLPDYRRFAKRAWNLLRVGGRMYLDGAAAVEKFAVSPFTRRYIWGGTHTYMAVQDVIGELLMYGFEIDEVVKETKDYGWTMEEWARRLDLAKEKIVAGWGEETYRIFRLFLWGGAHAFAINALQAYHVVAVKTSSRGPRPSTGKRLIHFLGKLR